MSLGKELVDKLKDGSASDEGFVEVGNADGVQCVCAAGTTLVNTGCKPCELGTYKGVASNNPCTACAISRATTAEQGATSERQCICPADYYMTPCRKPDGCEHAYECERCAGVDGGFTCKEQGATLERLPLLPGWGRGTANTTDVLECSKGRHTDASPCVGGDPPFSASAFKLCFSYYS